MKAIARSIRITPKKANLLAGMVRTKPVNEALGILKLLPKKAAGILYKVIHSAAHNAIHNLKQDQDSLFIKEIVVNKGPTLKRSVPISRGRVYPILKRTSHITVLLGLTEAAPAPEKTAAKSSVKKTTKKAASKIEESNS